MKATNQLILSKETERIVKSLARRIAGKRKDLVDDLVQEGYLVLYRAAKSYDPQGGVPLWGFAYKSLVYELLRAAKRLTQLLSADEQDTIDSLDELEGYEAARFVIDSNPTPCERYELEDTRKAIRNAVKLLPRNERIAVSLYYGLDGFYERPYSSIAEELDCSVEGARKAVDRGVNKLRVLSSRRDYGLCA